MITYDEIYNRMKSEFSAKSKYDFDEASDAAIRMRVLAGEIFNANRRRKRRVNLHSLSMNLLKTAFLFLKEVWSPRQIPSR